MRQGVKSLYRLEPHPLYALKKTGIQGDASPWQVLEGSALEVFPVCALFNIPAWGHHTGTGLCIQYKQRIARKG